MDKPLNSLDWSLVQAFLTVAEHGSLSAAARALGTSQPTLGRQVKQIEDRLGIAPLQRHARGYALTEAGQALLPHARAMRDAMREIELYAAGHEAHVSGTIRLTASEFVCHYVLPPILARLRLAHPEIEIELLPTDESENLLFREADIALRMYRPEQLDVVTRHLGDVGMGIFAARSYAARRGLPDTVDGLREHDLIGYDRSELILRGMRAAGFAVTRSDFALRCDDQTVYWELVRAGCGIGFGQRVVARSDPGIIEIDLGIAIPPLPIWLAAHDGLRHTPRVRLVWDFLADALAEVVT